MNDYSKWTILPQKVVAKKDSLYRLRAHNIVYLDDHTLYSGGVIKLCIKPFFKNSIITLFQNGDDAFNYVSKHIQTNKAIDLIITDINHPGLKGYHFVELIRHFENLCDTKKIPILVITMVGEEYLPKKITGPRVSLVNNYLTKVSSIDLIVHCLEEILL